jgi:hypothetical protein
MPAPHRPHTPSPAKPAHHHDAGGADAGEDAVYDEILRRLRNEQEQVGHLIRHPF